LQRFARVWLRNDQSSPAVRRAPDWHLARRNLLGDQRLLAFIARSLHVRCTFVADSLQGCPPVCKQLILQPAHLTITTSPQPAGAALSRARPGRIRPRLRACRPDGTEWRAAGRGWF